MTKVIQSYVFHKDKSWLVSTINRNYDTYEGIVRGPETMVWTIEGVSYAKKDLIHQSDLGFEHHIKICRDLHTIGAIKAD